MPSRFVFVRAAAFRRLLVHASAAAALALLPGFGLAQTALPERRVVMQADTDLPGGDLQPVFETSQEACVQLCLADAACAALTYNARARACFPKSSAGSPAPFAGALSGVVSAVDAAAEGRAAARLADVGRWLSDDDRRAARDQAQALGTLYPGTGEAVDLLRQSAADASLAGDQTGRVRWLGTATAATDGADDWLALAAAMRDAAYAADNDRETLASALNAATNAWLRDPGDGTAALKLWAELSERLDRGPDGLAALRQAAQAGGGGDAELATLIEGFQERHGFRVSDSRVDSDAADPRACVVFSDALADAADYRPFVALPDPAMAVEAQGSELCVTGLTRGQALRLTLRPGLPSQDGEVLARAVDLSLYVRDRNPQARFGGRAYLLPAAGDQGLTLRTVNAGGVDLTLYRMSDRNLVRALADQIFATPLDDWKAGTFTSDMGQEVWRGHADVAPAPGGGAHPVNAEVATRLDLRQAAGPLSPGIYALTAAVPGQSPDRSPPATQWFMISDLGLASYAGSDGMTVVVRGLSDAGPRAGVTVQLLSRGNAVLGTARTDDQGIARFDAGLVRGTGSAEPAVVTALVQGGGDAGTGAPTDMAFMSLLDPEFDLSDRGVEGAPPAPPIDVFVATDRGAYRAGEVAHATVMTRDERAQAIDGLPLTAVVIRPDGVEHARLMPAPAGAGGYVLDVPIPDTAPRGVWRIDFRVEESGPALASKDVLVEDFRPERIAFDLALPDAPLPAGQPVEADIAARWLFGAPAAGLPVEGELRLTPARALPGFDGFQFGRHDDDASPEIVAMPSGTTDAEGRFTARIDLPPALAQATQPFDARLTLTVREGAGRPVERADQRLVVPARGALGIRPGFDAVVAEGADAAFQVVALNPDLTLRAGPAEWVLNRVETDYQWYAVGGDWSYEPVTRRTRAANGTLDLTTAGPAALSVPVDWGGYELVVTGADGVASSVAFEAGWGAAGAGSDTPDRLQVTLDKPAYRSGDTARATLDAAADGVAVVSVLSNRVIDLRVVPVTAGRNTVDLPVTEEWGASAYVAVSAIRPLAPGTAEAPGAGGGPDGTTISAHAPIRALGIAPAPVDPADRAIRATLTAPAEVDPRGEVQVALAVEGAAPGQTVQATIWAVDQGILNLTGYAPPSATGHYFGQRRLGVALRDVYGRLILPGGAADGAIRSGGDAGSMQTQAPPPTEKLMAWFSGPVTLDESGRATVSVPLPDFNGELRVMALAWTDRAVGQTDTTILVRDPVVMTVTAPAFLSPGDRAQAQVSLTHVSGPAGDVGLAVEDVAAADPVAGPTLSGDAVTIATTLADRVALAERQAATLPLTLAAPDPEGLARLRVSARLPDGRTVTKDLSIPVQRQDAAVSRRMKVTVAPGTEQTVDLSPLGAFRPGTGRITLTSGAFARLDVPGALARLAAYPYGCSEQLSSRILPQLYAATLMPEGVPAPAPAGDPAATLPVDKAIAQILTRQTSDGSFGLWSAEGGDRWLNAYVTDVLSRARAAGQAVPDAAFAAALRSLQNGLNAAAEPQFAEPMENAATAYAAYVLAREHAAVISDLRYYVDTGAEGFATPLAAGQLGAALAAYGDQARADVMFRRAGALSQQAADPQDLFRADYGTLLRDRAGVVALAAEAGSRAIDLDALAVDIAAQVDAAAQAGAPLSTQEAGWIVLAAQALSQGPDAAGGLTLSGAPLTGAVHDVGDAGALPPVVLGNTGSAPVEVTLGATAVPVDPPAAGGTAFAISRRYHDEAGALVDPALVPLGTRLVAVIEVQPLAQADGRLLISDPLPAGFEIDNPNFLSQGEVEGLDWLGDTSDTDMAEFRQDRFAAGVTLYGTDPILLAYRLRAVTPGSFAHPAATVEDMYRPERRAWTDSGTTVVAP